MNELIPVGHYRAKLGEGPLWRDGHLLWLDIEGHELISLKENHAHVVRNFGFRVTAVASRSVGGFVFASERGVFVANRLDGQLTFIADPDPLRGRTRFNDGKCDAAGRFWAGTTGLQGEPELGSLYRIDPDGHCERILSSTTISNGMGWRPDNATFYFIDSSTGAVAAFPHDNVAGALDSAKTVVTISDAEGIRDRLAVDRDGRLWIALWDVRCVVCLDTVNGTRCDEIRLPASRVTSCSFGGEHLDDLYITIASIGLDATALSRQPLAGSLLKVRPGACGMSANRFEG